MRKKTLKVVCSSLYTTAAQIWEKLSILYCVTLSWDNANRSFHQLAPSQALPTREREKAGRG